MFAVFFVFPSFLLVIFFYPDRYKLFHSCHWLATPVILNFLPNSKIKSEEKYYGSNFKLLSVKLEIVRPTFMYQFGWHAQQNVLKVRLLKVVGTWIIVYTMKNIYQVWNDGFVMFELRQGQGLSPTKNCTRQ